MIAVWVRGATAHGTQTAIMALLTCADDNTTGAGHTMARSAEVQ